MGVGHGKGVGVAALVGYGVTSGVRLGTGLVVGAGVTRVLSFEVDSTAGEDGTGVGEA
jgi:hypothetical protein